MIGSIAFKSIFATHTIVTTSPSLTEIIFQLGYGSSILATSQFSDFPEEAKRLPRIGFLFSPNIERIFRFSPDWVLIDAESSPTQLGEQLFEIGLKKLNISIRSVNDLFTESERILKTLFEQKNASAIDNYRQIFLKSKTVKGRNFTFIAIAWASPTVLIGNNTFLSDLLNQVGGKNLVGEFTAAPYPTIADEWLMKHVPEYVFVLADSEDQFRVIKTHSAKWWPAENIKFVFLPSSWYARSSFSPIFHLEALRSNIE